MPEPIRILVVDPSAAERRRFHELLAAADDLLVVGEAQTEARAAELAGRLRPDVVIVGCARNLDGFKVTESIMHLAAAPVIIVAPPYLAEHGAFRAVEVGAVAFVELPVSDGAERRKEEAELLYLVRAMAEVKVVSRRPRAKKPRATDSPAPVRRSGPIDVVAIGASTGGPQAVYSVLSGLPPGFPVPLLIVQHLAQGFHGSLVKWLQSAGPVDVRVAADGEPLAPGTAYIGPDDVHLGVSRGGRIMFSDAPPENGLKPAVSFLFRSVGAAFGPRAAGVLLTGMGRDGAEELKIMRDGGAVTIAQDEASSTVYGMPKVAVEIGGASQVLDINDIAPALVELARQRADESGGNDHG